MKHTILDSSDFRVGRQSRRTRKGKGQSCNDTLSVVGGEDKDAVKTSFLVVRCDGFGSSTECDNSLT